MAVFCNTDEQGVLVEGRGRAGVWDDLEVPSFHHLLYYREICHLYYQPWFITWILAVPLSLWLPANLTMLSCMSPPWSVRAYTSKCNILNLTDRNLAPGRFYLFSLFSIGQSLLCWSIREIKPVGSWAILNRMYSLAGHYRLGLLIIGWSGLWITSTW